MTTVVRPAPLRFSSAVQDCLGIANKDGCLNGLVIVLLNDSCSAVVLPSLLLTTFLAILLLQIQDLSFLGLSTSFSHYWNIWNSHSSSDFSRWLYLWSAVSTLVKNFLALVAILSFFHFLRPFPTILCISFCPIPSIWASFIGHWEADSTRLSYHWSQVPVAWSHQVIGSILRYKCVTNYTTQPSLASNHLSSSPSTQYRGFVS